MVSVYGTTITNLLLRILTLFSWEWISFYRIRFSNLEWFLKFHFFEFWLFIDSYPVLVRTSTPFKKVVFELFKHNNTGSFLAMVPSTMTFLRNIYHLSILNYLFTDFCMISYIHFCFNLSLFYGFRFFVKEFSHSPSKYFELGLMLSAPKLGMFNFSFYLIIQIN